MGEKTQTAPHVHAWFEFAWQGRVCGRVRERFPASRKTGPGLINAQTPVEWSSNTVEWSSPRPEDRKAPLQVPKALSPALPRSSSFSLAECRQVGRAARDESHAQHAPQPRPCAATKNVLRRVESWLFQRRWLQRDDRRYRAQCDELEAERTITDSITVLAELAACIVLDARSLCMLCAERSLE